MAKIATRINTATAYEVRAANPLLSLGEPFYESDTGGFKIGDGAFRYNDLPYAGIVLERTGIQGEQGIQGIPGDKGDKGDTGSQGNSAYQVAVSNGYVGSEADWILSLRGPKGDQGVKGDQGIQGTQGLKGDTGLKGDKGDQGIQGIQGLKGDTGPTAQWDTISGKPAVVASGATKAEARASVDAAGVHNQSNITLWWGTEAEYASLANVVKYAAGFIGFVY